MAYWYETHLHTEESSLCGSSPGRDYIRSYREIGFSGIFVTDHFFGGNTCIPKDLPWRKWVDRFRRGYDNARAEGDKWGLDVFFGWEETFEGDDYLIYGLEPEWLYDHPEMRTWSRGEQFATVSEAGGCVVQAHPFRQRRYIQTIHLSAGCVHAVEVANAGNERDFDALAYRYAGRLGVPMTAGSDIHMSEFEREDIYGVAFDKKLTSTRDYAERILRGDPMRLRYPTGRVEWTGGERIGTPVDIRDADDQSTGGDIWEFLG